MAKKVTLMKRCGNPNCTDPRCDYVIVQKQESIWQRIKNSNPLVHPTLVIGLIVFLIAHLGPLILLFEDFITALGG